MDNNYDLKSEPLRHKPAGYFRFSNSIDDVRLGSRPNSHIISYSDVTGQWEVNGFQNTIPVVQDTELLPQTKEFRHNDLRNRPNYSLGSKSINHRRNFFKSLVWPVVLVTFPIALLSAGLLALVFGYRVKSSPTQFTLTSPDERTDSSHILVNYSASRLLFFASFLSTLAPLLSPFIMTLWSLPTARNMLEASANPELSRLPTGYQFSLLVGITLASTDRLRGYLEYLLTRKRTRATIPPVLHRAALMLVLAIVLAIAVFATDIALHFSTETINFDQISSVLSPTHQFGRGLSELCIDFNRTANDGFPCSLDLSESALDYLAEENEIFYLRQNTSSNSQIQIIPQPGSKYGDLAILMPQLQNVPSDVDYRASSIGVSTQCFPLTSACDMRTGGVQNISTYFNCSDNFWGVLGVPPNTSALSSVEKIPDSNVPPMSVKISQSLQIGYFTDISLDIPYNSWGLDPSTGEPGYGPPPLSDDQLINPVYFGIAARFSEAAVSVDSELLGDPGIYSGSGHYDDFVLRCAYTTMDVEYSVVNGEIWDLSYSPTQNGSVAEMFHGTVALSPPTSGGSYVLSENVAQVALERTSEALAQEWANLQSVNIMSVIGSVTTPRTNILEQNRTSLLVARVPKVALGSLIACGLAYTILGIALGISAYKASRSADLYDLADRLSLAGLAAAAFDDRGNRHSMASEPEDMLRGIDRLRTKRIGVTRGLQEGVYQFETWDMGEYVSEP